LFIHLTRDIDQSDIIRKKDKTKTRLFIISVVVSLGMFIRAFSNSLLEIYFLSQDGRYAITTDIPTGYTTRGSTIGYAFKVNNKSYSGLTIENLNYDKHYFIKFYPKNPEYNKLVFVEATETDKRICHLKVIKLYLIIKRVTCMKFIL
jgi:hypothetical protein